MSAPPASPIFPGHLQFDNTLGALQVGLVISTCLFGISIAQAYVYYQASAKDHLWVKAVVASLLLTDTAHTCLAAHAVYHYTVINFSNPLILLENEWSLTMQVSATSLSAFIAQCFFATRVWTLGRKNLPLIILIVGLSLSQFAFSLVVIERLFVTKLTSRLHELIWAMISSLACTAACDTLITISLCYYLHHSRTGIERTETMINKLLMWTINTGMITTISAIADLVCVSAMQDNLVYVGVFFIVSKLYTNCVLASLNFRGRLRMTTQVQDMGGRFLGNRVQLSDVVFKRHLEVSTTQVTTNGEEVIDSLNTEQGSTVKV